MLRTQLNIPNSWQSSKWWEAYGRDSMWAWRRSTWTRTIQDKTLNNTVEINTPIGQIYIISGYFTFRDPIEIYLNHLDMVLNELIGDQVMIGVAANAKSQLWHTVDSDDKGDDLEAFIKYT